jgi:hypothetical protein
MNSSMEQADLSRYDQSDPDHPTEDEFIDRAARRLDEKLRKVAEIEERIAQNSGRKPEPPADPPA